MSAPSVPTHDVAGAVRRTGDDLVGCGIHSPEEILPEHQQLHVGDLIRSGRDTMPCWQVVEVVPERHHDVWRSRRVAGGGR